MSTKRAWLRHTLLTVTEHGGIRTLDAVTQILLIRVMSAAHYGLFSVYQSWAGILMLLFPSLEVALFRHYGELKESGRLAGELALFRRFNFLKLALAAALAVGLAFVAQPAAFGERLALLTLALALPLSQALYGFLREPLRFEMKQHLVAALGLAQRALLIGALVTTAIVFRGGITALVASALAAYVAFGFAWHVAARGSTPAARSAPRDGWRRIGRTLAGTVLWIHLIGVLLQSIQTLDLFFLGVYRVDLAEIGRYGIALKAASFFQLLPVALVNSFGVYLGKNPRGRDAADGRAAQARERRLVWRYCGLFAVLCLALLALGYAVGAPLLAFLAKGKLDPEAAARTLVYFRWQLAGLMLLCASHPLSTYLTARAPLRGLFFGVFLPWLCFAALAYGFAAARGPVAAAQVNLAVYAFLVAFLVAFQARFRI